MSEPIFAEIPPPLIDYELIIDYQGKRVTFTGSMPNAEELQKTLLEITFQAQHVAEGWGAT